jgi:hypothetical protein
MRQSSTPAELRGVLKYQHIDQTHRPIICHLGMRKEGAIDALRNGIQFNELLVSQPNNPNLLLNSQLL